MATTFFEYIVEKTKKAREEQKKIENELINAAFETTVKPVIEERASQGADYAVIAYNGPNRGAMVSLLEDLGFNAYFDEGLITAKWNREQSGQSTRPKTINAHVDDFGDL
jgi:hypothetical protein